MYEGKKETETQRMGNKIKNGKWQTERKRKEKQNHLKNRQVQNKGSNWSANRFYLTQDMVHCGLLLLIFFSKAKERVCESFCLRESVCSSFKIFNQ